MEKRDLVIVSALLYALYDAGVDIDEWLSEKQQLDRLEQALKPLMGDTENIKEELKGIVEEYLEKLDAVEEVK